LLNEGEPEGISGKMFDFLFDNQRVDDIIRESERQSPKQQNAKMIKQHEETIESHAKSNALMAIDQAEDYGGIEGAFEAFRQNTVDSCLEDGYSGDEAMDASGHFCAMFKKITGVEF
jgi:hypothetical protein